MECPVPGREWMYLRRKLNDPGVSINIEFIEGVEQFDKFARRQDVYRMNNKYRCPCKTCKNKSFLLSEEVKSHLYDRGFLPNYWYWTCHGEDFNGRRDEIQRDNNTNQVCDGDSSFHNNNHMVDMVDMVHDAFETDEVQMRDSPTASAAEFYEMLSSSQQPLFEGCTLSELDLAVRLISLKSDNTVSNKGLNGFIQLIKDLCPPSALVPKDYHAVMRKVKALGLDVQTIHCCKNGCMLYYKDRETLEFCKFCKEPRRKKPTKSSKNKLGAPYAKMQYLPLTPRLQRLYASDNTAHHMRWHHEHPRVQGTLLHPRDGEAWKHFDMVNPDFAQEPRNVRLGLCSDGFTPFSNIARPYSVWPIVVTPYNLPPSMCMTTPYMFLTCMIPGPKSPGKNIDVYMEPLIDELGVLWDAGVETFDISSGTNYKMRAAVMWTINDYPAYGMLSGWSTHGKLACAVCMRQTKATTLKNGRKRTWFDCHRCFLPPKHPFRKNMKSFKKGVKISKKRPRRISGVDMWNEVRNYKTVKEDNNIVVPGFKDNEHNWTKQSIFWELPYWRDHLLPHNLDVMHIEKNFCDNITDTVLDTGMKTKDNQKARMDLEILCDREELHLVPLENDKFFKPKAIFTLTPDERRACCEWLKNIHLPDGYGSNFANCVDASCSKLQNMKSHDNHVFLQTLLPVAFSALPPQVLGPLVELSNFFRNLCASQLDFEELMSMSENICVILCKLETIFPPGFWNVMEHVVIHLAEEAALGGPVHYRWMYPFERFFGWLKRKCTQKSHVEVTMVNMFLQYEITKFSTFYFDKSVECMRSRAPRNQTTLYASRLEGHTLSVFHSKGRLSGPINKKKYLDDRDKDQKSLHLHVLLNCEEVEPYIETFRKDVKEYHPNKTDEEMDVAIEEHFARWFTSTVKSLTYFPEEKQSYLRDLSQGPVNVKYFSGYIGEGVRFQTRKRCEGKTTSNCGVLVKGVGEGTFEDDYYGIVEDILQVEYAGEPIKRVILFKCDWYDPSEVRDNPKLSPYAEINPKKKLKKYDPFILADTASQVVYLKYPDRVPRKAGLCVAIPNKVRGNPTGEDAIALAFQEDYMTKLVVDPLDIPSLLSNENNDEHIIIDGGFGSGRV